MSQSRTNSAGGSSRIEAVDMLRGVAALLVLAVHLPFSWGSGHAAGSTTATVFPNWTMPFFRFGATGVDLFLVISGFCIHMQWARSQGQINFFGFWRRRLRRLYPPY